MQERLFKAYFTDGLELADRDTLIRIAEETGLDASEVRDVLITDRFSDEVRSDENEAFYSQVTAVPFFVIDNSYAIPGALPVEQIEKILSKIIESNQI